MTDEIEVTQADRDAAARLNGYANWSVYKVAPQLDVGWMELCAHDFARHRQAAFADGFSAALQGAEAAIWRIEDDAFLYANVSKALQEVISELQAMEQNWTGRATIEHRQAAIKERDAENERLREALQLLHDNIVAAWPSLSELGPVANARAALGERQ